MTVVVGAVIGIGLTLICAPFVWPKIPRKRALKQSYQTQLRSWLNTAGFNAVPVSFFVTFSVFLGMIFATVLHTIFGVIAVSLASLGIGCAAPCVLVRWRSVIRARAHHTIWPDIVDHIISAVRSGLALPDGIIILGRSGPATTRWAFQEFEREYMLTGNFYTSIDGLKNRLADPAADRILETIKMAREVGGTELPTVLRALGNYLRSELVLRREVEARQSWVRNAAKLGVAAPWVVLCVLGARPEAQRAYNSFTGIVMIVVGCGISVVAYRMMLKFGRMPQENRWFR